MEMLPPFGEITRNNSMTNSSNGVKDAPVNGCDELRINGAIGRRQRKEAVNGLQGWSDATFMGSERWIAWGLVELIDGGGL